MWGSAVSPGRGGRGGLVMIHKILATLSFFMLRLSDGICFGYLFIKLRGPVQHVGRWKNRGFGKSAPPIRHKLSHPSAEIIIETSSLTEE